MIKLVRNTFAQENITNKNDNTIIWISWMFIAKLICKNSNDCMLPIKLGKGM